jgi:carbohydrate-binding DOMON domain-containing protein
MTQVKGEGPPGVSIKIVDVTYMGEQIGGGIVGEDGTFSIEASPLREGHRIGIMLDAELPSDLAMFKGELWGEGGMSIPKVGDIYASAQTRGRE